MKRALRIAWLTVLWLILWRDASIANLASGLLIAVVVERALSLEWAGPSMVDRIRPVALVRFALYFLWKLVEANVYLAREVLTPRNQIQTGIIAVPMTGCPPFVVTLVANAVSLTPGTVTLEVRHGDVAELYIHVLHLHDIEDARAEVHTFTRLAHEAFPARTQPPARPGSAS